jgi:hypothetical protein
LARSRWRLICWSSPPKMPVLEIQSLVASGVR